MQTKRCHGKNTGPCGLHPMGRMPGWRRDDPAGFGGAYRRRGLMETAFPVTKERFGAGGRKDVCHARAAARAQAHLPQLRCMLFHPQDGPLPGACCAQTAGCCAKSELSPAGSSDHLKSRRLHAFEHAKMDASLRRKIPNRTTSRRLSCPVSSSALRKCLYMIILNADPASSSAFMHARRGGKDGNRGC